MSAGGAATVRTFEPHSPWAWDFFQHNERSSQNFEGNLTATEYVSRDSKQAVLFVFQHSQQLLRSAPAIYLRGLEERAVYRVQPLDDKLMEKQEKLSGSFLMNQGLNFKMTGDFDSTSVTLERIE